MKTLTLCFFQKLLDYNAQREYNFSIIVRKEKTNMMKKLNSIVMSKSYYYYYYFPRVVR